MSDSEEDASALPEPIRTVTDVVDFRPDAEMDAIGWSIGLGLLILLVPLLPFIAIVWLLSKLFERAARRAT